MAAVTVLLSVAAVPSFAALPRTYQIQRVDSPAPTPSGNFGRALAVVGDVNSDGEQDMLVGNDKHGTRAGQVFVISGADGSRIRELQRPDEDAVGSGRPAGFGAAVGKIGFNQGGGSLYDIGSCPGGDSADADAYCDNNPIGAADGVPDLLVTASGVDVNPVTGAIDPLLNNDLGVAYVFDGRSGALLKKLLMPAVDRQMEVALGNDPRYGRAALSPGGLFPCAGHAGIGPCPTVPDAIAGGDVNGGGTADILVAATDLDETPANSQPSSPCAASAAATCPSAGRVYVYYGEGIAGSNPATVDQTPDQTIRDLYSKPDGGSRVGTTLIPVGDLGRCTTSPAPAPGSRCPNANRNADGRADFVSAGPDYDASGFNGSGTVFLHDGPTGTILRQFDHPEPQPVSAMGLAQNGLVQPAFGDLGQSATWDIYSPSTHQNVGGVAVGRGYVFNGDITARDRFIPFAQLNDPTPNSSGNFGASAAGVGNIDESNPQNELLIAAIGPHAPGTNPDVVNDAHFFNTVTERVLQTIPAPDQQPGGGFGEGVAPLGDLNGDGFLDFAIGGGGYDLRSSGGPCASTCEAAGRLYIFRSDNSPAPAPERGRGTPPGQQPPSALSAFAGCPASSANVIRGAAAGGRLTGTLRGDRIFGGTGNDIVDGLAGDDCIDLGPGTDTGQGGLGDDLLLGGLGADRMSGSSGNDGLRGGPSADRMNGGFGNDRLHGQAGGDRVSGSRGRDRVNGGSANDVISAGSSNDRVAGDQGNDRINGNSGNDSLSGNSGRDRISGSTGGDRISGGGGNDRISARDGRRDRVDCGRGRDTVIADRVDRVARSCERVRRR